MIKFLMEIHVCGTEDMSLATSNQTLSCIKINKDTFSNEFKD